MRTGGSIAFLCLTAFCGTAIAAGTAPAGPGTAPAAAPAAPMPDDEPMHTGMMKKGMTVGDVRKAAMQEKAKMDGMMEKERKEREMKKSAR